MGHTVSRGITRVFEGVRSREFFDDAAVLRVSNVGQLRIAIAVSGKNSPNRSRVKYHELFWQEDQAAAKWSHQHEVAVTQSTRDRSFFCDIECIETFCARD